MVWFREIWINCLCKWQLRCMPHSTWLQNEYTFHINNTIHFGTTTDISSLNDAHKHTHTCSRTPPFFLSVLMTTYIKLHCCLFEIASFLIETAKTHNHNKDSFKHRYHNIQSMDTLRNLPIRCSHFEGENSILKSNLKILLQKNKDEFKWFRIWNGIFWTL